MFKLLLLAVAMAGRVQACSDFYLGDYLDTPGVDSGAFKISARSFDYESSLAWVLLSVPEGTARVGGTRADALRWTSTFGYLSFTVLSAVVAATPSDGLNTAGLSCSLLALLGSEYEPPRAGVPTLDPLMVCTLLLETCATVADARAALGALTITDSGSSELHWAVRDATGASLVVEVLGGAQELKDDLNDGGVSGFGVLTNEPPFEAQRAMARLDDWKRTTRARPAAAVPGGWYPDERFLRAHLVKAGLFAPGTYQEAVAQAVAVLNTVQTPMGEQYATDTPLGGDAGDHTRWATVRDHANATLYFRTAANPNLRRARLADFDFAPGAAPRIVPLEDTDFFVDVGGVGSRS